MAHQKSALEENHSMNLRQTPRHFFFLLCFASGTLLLFAPLFFNSTISLSNPLFPFLQNSGIADTAISCDRADNNSDICFMSGDVRTHSPSSSIILYPSPSNPSNFVKREEEKIRPYTRKWETLGDVDEISLRTGTRNDSFHHKCDVQHDAPALVFSEIGYMGNLFHSFRDGIVPLYITSQHLNKRVVFVVLRYRKWWYQKYEEILSQLSNYPVVDFSNDTRTHCFPGAIVGLRFHGTLSVDPRKLHDHKSIRDFRNLLAKAYNRHNHDYKKIKNRTPRLVIFSRKGSREIENERDVVQIGKELGFHVEVIIPNDAMPLKYIYDTLSTCDVAMGVHGAALTHFLFMRLDATLIQIAPLGIEELAWKCFGEPALKMGIRYVNYTVRPSESSLVRKYGLNDPIVMDPDGMRKNKGWKYTKEVYFDGQNVTLDLNRVRKMLAEVLLG